MEFLIDLLFPKRCIGCTKLGGFICEQCFTKIRPISYLKCPLCLEFSLYGKTHSKCYKKIDIDGLFAAVSYIGITKKIVNKSKNKPYISNLANTMGKILCEELSQNELFFKLLNKNVIIVPLPLTSTRFKEQGYNHTSLLASYVAQYFHIKYKKDLLIKINSKFDNKQGKNGQFSYLNGLFCINKKYKNKLKGRTVIVIDDVVITCSTLRKVARILKENGAQKVWGVTFAMAK